ncbi:alpha/beta fold hydrolase [Actinomycetospora aeridis]|uniref:Alpha/beta hydrolase n=1 Tax=Actinomycetospora aeridis TaxID=3129231 RepID=A0ABU8NG02_9PSEU
MSTNAPAINELRVEGAAGIDLAATRWNPPCAARGTVLFLHGGGQTRHSWRRTAQTLADDGWTTVAVDARGHGDSDWSPDGDYGLGVLADDLRAVVAALGVRPVLVGASLGGRTALLAEGEGPSLAAGLVLVDVTPRVDRTGVDRILDFMRSGLDGFASLEDAADAIAAYDPSRQRPAHLDGLRRNLRWRDGRWFWHWDPRFVAGDAPTPERPGRADPERACAAAARVVVPTLLVRGVQSEVVSPEAAAELRELIPHAEQIDVDGAGHMVTGDDNDVFTTGLRAFLQGTADQS